MEEDYNGYFFTSGIIPRRLAYQVNKLLFRLSKDNAIIQILDFDQTFNLKSNIKLI